MEAAPIIVTATFGGEDRAWVDGLRAAHFPPERNHLAAHLTLFHHLPPSALGALSTRLAALAAAAPPPATVVGTMSLGCGVALRIESRELHTIRADLAAAFGRMLTPQDAAGWRPHVTIQNKVAPAAAKALLAEVATWRWPRPLAIAGLASWWYRGGPWEPIREWRFRG